MTTIIVFPQQYTLINLYVQELLLLHALSREAEHDVPIEIVKWVNYEDADFHVALKDGRMYAFTASTPSNISRLMERDNIVSFISPGLILVREISLEVILNALEHCLRLREYDRVPLEHFGVLQE